MGNSRQTQFACGFSQESIPSPAVPPPATSADPIMSALAQMMSKLTEVSNRLDRVEGAKAQCSDASTDQRDGKRIELPLSRAHKNASSRAKSTGKTELSRYIFKLF